MAMKIMAVRIGDRYGPEYEKYLEEKLPEYEFIWIREPNKGRRVVAVEQDAWNVLGHR